jgi:hypothetical protein
MQNRAYKDNLSPSEIFLLGSSLLTLLSTVAVSVLW